MRLLTVFTIILLPLTLIAGIFGMNGLDLNQIEVIPGGFIVISITMVCIAGGLLAYFIKRRWVLYREKDKYHGFLLENKESPQKTDAKSQVNYHIFKREKNG